MNEIDLLIQINEKIELFFYVWLLLTLIKLFAKPLISKWRKGVGIKDE